MVLLGEGVIAVKYRDGVMCVCDTLLTYRSGGKYGVSRDRYYPVGDKTLLLSSGAHEDYQYVAGLLQAMHDTNTYSEGGITKNAEEYSSYLSRVLYQRRCKMSPLFVNMLVMGEGNDGSPFVGSVDLYGLRLVDDFLATGMASYFCLPLLREHAKPDMSEQEARELLLRCMCVFAQWAKLSSTQVQFATVTRKGVSLEEPCVALAKNIDVADAIKAQPFHPGFPF